MNAPRSPDTTHLRSMNQLLEMALALPEQEREQWLQTLPPDKLAFAPLLRALLARASIETDTFMRRPVAAPFEDVGHADGLHDSAGQLVGPYRLIRELGAGGMSIVWLAERADGALQREVALKLPRAGWSAGLAERMARERDILAALEHPNIARLYDAGVTSSGRPYLAMEFVDGQPIDQFAGARNLTVEARLRLFLQVAQAVAHAHARLVVHRDLKPTNILVTHAGDVRLLDFGVAKLLEGDTTRDTKLTQLSGRVLTPDYASPEQIRGEPLTVGSDVYSLGVVLYELVTGQRPYKLKRDSAAALEEAITDADVPPASTQVSGDLRLARQLRGDIDTVLAKALRKDPARRYPSVEALAADLQRHLDGEAVLAQPRSRAYHIAKFVRRHRLPIAAASAVATALIAGAGVALWQAREATRQSEAARSRLAQLEASIDFMSMVLTEGPQAGEALTLEELVKRSESMADTFRTGNPVERAIAADAVADWHISYGGYDRAEKLLTRTLEALTAGVEPAVVTLLRCKRAHAMASLGKVDAAIVDLDAGIAASKNDPSIASYCLHQRARVARTLNDASGALRYVQEAQRLFDAAGRTSVHTRALLTAELAYALSLNGRPVEAHERYGTAVGLLASAGRAEGASAVSVYNNWAIALLNAGDPQGALEKFDHSMEISARRSTTGNVPVYVVSNRAVALRALGRFDEAIEAHERAVLVARVEHNTIFEVHALAGQGLALHALGRLNEAQQHLDAAGDVRRRSVLPADHPATLRARIAQAMVWQSQGRLRDADEALAEVQARHARLQLKVAATVQPLILRAEIAIAEGRLDDAQRLAEQALAVARETQGDFEYSSITGHAWLTMARVHQARGAMEPARAACQRAREHLVRTVGALHPHAQEAAQLARTLGS